MKHWSDTLETASQIVRDKVREEKLIVYLSIALMLCGVIAYIVDFSRSFQPIVHEDEDDSGDANSLFNAQRLAYNKGYIHGMREAIAVIGESLAPKEKVSA